MNRIYATLILIIIIWIIHIHYQSHILHNLLSGFWEADSSFCEESDLSMFCLYLDEDYSIFGSRACYILATQDDAIILNEPTIARISLEWLRPDNMNLYINSPKYFNISFQDINEEAIGVFPKIQTIRFYPSCCKMVLYHDDVITAVLYKNPVNSELKSIINKE